MVMMEPNTGKYRQQAFSFQLLLYHMHCLFLHCLFKDGVSSTLHLKKYFRFDLFYISCIVYFIGGHYFAVGGSLDGGKVIGKYPENLWEVMAALGRRPVPSLPWDSVWNGVAEWAGTSIEDLSKVCPNRGSFDESDLFDAATLFGSNGVAA